WQASDPAADSRVRLLAPFFLEQCTPRLHMGASPLFGWRSDADGTAGFVLNYYLRRDRDHETDVLFPLFYRFGQRLSDGRMETTVAGTFYYHSHDGDWDAGVFPLAYLGRRGDTRYSLVLPPLVIDVRDPQGSTTIAGAFFRRQRGDQDDYGVVPLFFHGTRPG